MHRFLNTTGTLPIGIDIGTGGVRVAQLSRRGRKLRLRSTARVPFEDGVEDAADAPARIDATIEAVRHALREGRFAGPGIVVSLDERLVRTRAVRQPGLSQNEREQAVALDAPIRLGFSSGETCTIGWLDAGTIVHGEERRDELIYMGVADKPVERLLDGLDKSGLLPLAVEPSFTAGVRSVVRTAPPDGEEEAVRVFVDVGHRHSNVFLARGETVLFYKLFELGGRDITAAGADRLGISVEDAEEIRRQRMQRNAGIRGDNGDPIDERVERAMYEAIRPLLHELGHEVSLCIRHYGTTFRGKRPEECLLLGGTALEPSLAETIESAIHLPTRVHKPFDGIDTSRAVGSIERRGPCAEWSVATGLSMRGLLGSRATRETAISGSGASENDRVKEAA